MSPNISGKHPLNSLFKCFKETMFFHHFGHTVGRSVPSAVPLDNCRVFSSHWRLKGNLERKTDRESFVEVVGPQYRWWFCCWRCWRCWHLNSAWWSVWILKVGVWFAWYNWYISMIFKYINNHFYSTTWYKLFTVYVIFLLPTIGSFLYPQCKSKHTRTLDSKRPSWIVSSATRLVWCNYH